MVLQIYKKDIKKYVIKPTKEVMEVRDNLVALMKVSAPANLPTSF
jgi:hypothetical protein